MPTFGKKTISEDEDSDDMGPTKQILNKKSSIKKRKRMNTKQEEKEEENTDSAPIIASPNHINDNNEPEKKKMKKEKKPKQKATPKKKAPLDLDRQCGVLIAPNNNPCTRSLTCKIHAMGAKRAVEGRSQPFNELLAAYQKKGIGRPQVPGSSSNDKDNIKSKAVDSNSKSSNATKKTSLSNNATNNDLSSHNTSLLNNKDEDHDIDSDEETESVRMAIEQNKPIPLGTKKLFYVRRKRKYYKLRDILLEAITPKDNNNTNATSATTTTTTTTTTSMSAAEVSLLDQIGF